MLVLNRSEITALVDLDQAAAAIERAYRTTSDGKINLPPVGHHRYHESLGNLTPADVYYGQGKTILLEHERIKRQTIQQRRLQHQTAAA